MNSLTKAISRCDDVASQAKELVIFNKDAISGGDIVASPGTSQFSGFGEQSRYRHQYNLNRGWVHSVISAVAREAAGQDVNVGRMLGAAESEDKRSAPGRVKQFHKDRMVDSARSKAARQEIELVIDHPLLDLLDHPNSIQGRWEFVYSFIFNLLLTGWSYVVAGEDEEGNPEFYSLPTNWIRPRHEGGAFSSFELRNPNNPTAEPIILDRDQVGFAHLPNPANPLDAISPGQAQITAIRIDDHIQTSQENFFENGIFPSVLVKVGKEPYPGVSGQGTRPRLSPAQKRGVNAAIRKAMSGVAHYGDPAIIDGLIEDIVPFSREQSEIGWEKSEQTVKDRILSSFGVNEFILGATIKVGGYAQATEIKNQFCKRVNTYLDLLSTLMTNFMQPKVVPEENLLIWWEKCEARDPQIMSVMIRDGRKNNDITKNEYRALVGLPPIDEDDVERSPLLDTVGGMTGAAQLFREAAQGGISRDTLAKLLAMFFQRPLEEMQDLVGTDEQQEVMESLEVLENAFKQLQEPLKIEWDDRFNSTVMRSLSVADEASRQAEEASRQADESRRIAQHANDQFSKLANLVATDQVNKRTEDRLVEISTTNLLRETKQQASVVKQQLIGTVKSVLNDLSDKIDGAFDLVHESTKQPVQVQVLNEVLPAPVNVEVTNEVESPTVSIRNEIESTPIIVSNQIDMSQLQVVVDATPITIEPPQVDVAAPRVEVDQPEVSIEHRIAVDDIPAAKVQVDVSRENTPKQALITHPDGRVSQIALE